MQPRKSRSNLGERESSELARLKKERESKGYLSLQDEEPEEESSSVRDYLKGEPTDPQNFAHMYQDEISKQGDQPLNTTLRFIKVRLGNVSDMATRLSYSAIEIERLKQLQYGVQPSSSPNPDWNGWGIASIVDRKNAGDFKEIDEKEQFRLLKDFKPLVDKYYKEEVKKYGGMSREGDFIKGIKDGGPRAHLYQRFVHMLHHLLNRTEGLRPAVKEQARGDVGIWAAEVKGKVKDVPGSVAIHRKSTSKKG